MHLSERTHGYLWCLSAYQSLCWPPGSLNSTSPCQTFQSTSWSPGPSLFIFHVHTLLDDLLFLSCVCSSTVIQGISLLRHLLPLRVLLWQSCCLGPFLSLDHLLLHMLLKDIFSPTCSVNSLLELLPSPSQISFLPWTQRFH